MLSLEGSSSLQAWRFENREICFIKLGINNIKKEPFLRENNMPKNQSRKRSEILTRISKKNKAKDADFSSVGGQKNEKQSQEFKGKGL